MAPTMLRRYFGAFHDLRHLPKSTWYVCLASLVNRAGTMVLPFLTLYLTQERHLDARSAGSIAGLYGIGGLIAGPLSGYLCDRFGAARVVRLSLLGVVALLCTLPALGATWAAAVGVFVFALANETFRPASVILARVDVPKERLRQSYGAHRLAVNLGLSVGPAIGGLLVVFSFRSIFYVNAVAALGAAWLIQRGFFRNRPTGSRDDVPGENERLRPSAIFHAMTDRRMAWFTLALFPIVAVFFQYESTMPLFLIRDLGLAEWHYGMLFTVNTLLVAAIEIPLLAATQRYSHRTILLAGTAATALGFGGLAFVTGFSGTLVTVFLWTVGEILLFPQAQAYVTEIAPPSREGTYTGILTAFYNLGLTLGPPLGSYIYQGAGHRTLWLACLGAGGVSMLLISRVREGHPALRLIAAP